MVENENAYLIIELHNGDIFANIAVHDSAVYCPKFGVYV